MLNTLRKHRNKVVVVALLLIVIIGLLSPWRYIIEGNPVKLEVKIKLDHKDTIQLFYTTNEQQFSEENSIRINVDDTDNFQTVSFDLPNKSIKKIRLDTGSVDGQAWIREIKLKRLLKEYSWDGQVINEEFEPSLHIQGIGIDNSQLHYNIVGNDPYLVSKDISNIYNEVSESKNIFIFLNASIALMAICIVYVFSVFYKRALTFIKGIIESRRLIFDLAKNDFKVKYAGSYLGIIWSFIQPIITILIYWFVFQVGFRSGSRPDGTPFVLWLICGMVPWFYFSEALQNATNSLLENSYLVKKVVFKVNILPVVKIVSSLFIHIFFVIFLTIITVISGRYPSVYTLQMFYYLVCMFVLLIGLSWVTSALVVFLKDVSQIVSVILQIGFWITPIVWSTDIIPKKSIEYFLKLNPMFYIVQGYRDSFIENIWFWNRYNQTIYFWLITGVIFFCGAVLFKRLKPHFSDVL